MPPADTTAARRAMRRQAWSIAAALVPFGLAFGVACNEAGLRWPEALAFSSLVFSGGAQFAAVGVLADDGAVVTAVAAGLLISLRLLAYGVLMAPSFDGPRWRRAARSQLMIDEAVAIALTHDDDGLRRYGFLVGGVAVFVLWNLSTVVGSVALSSAGDLVERFGLDATIPASFLALLWPRLADPVQRLVAAAGAAIAVAVMPVAPAGVPIIAAGLGVVAARFVKRAEPLR